MSQLASRKGDADGADGMGVDSVQIDMDEVENESAVVLKDGKGVLGDGGGDEEVDGYEGAEDHESGQTGGEWGGAEAGKEEQEAGEQVENKEAKELTGTNEDIVDHGKGKGDLQLRALNDLLEAGDGGAQAKEVSPRQVTSPGAKGRPVS